MTVFREDVSSLRPPVRMPDGRILVDGCLSRVGVFVYLNPDGSTRREYRPPEEVLKVDSMKSFALCPVTNNHPRTADGKINADNARTFMIGAVGENIRKDGNLILASLMIMDRETIDQMERGKVSLSCGYTCKLDETPGEINGVRYDAIQRNIRGNHVAIVDNGRAGPDARVRMDAAITVHDERLVAAEGNTRTMDYEKLYNEAKARADAEHARADSAEAAKATAERERNEARANLARVEGERDAQKARADSAESARTDAADKAYAAGKARSALESAAHEVLGAEELAKLNPADKDPASDRALKCAIVAKIDGAEIPADKSQVDAYVDARFDYSMSRKGKSADALADLRKAGEDPARADAVRGSADQARTDMINRHHTAWQKPVTLRKE